MFSHGGAVSAYVTRDERGIREEVDPPADQAGGETITRFERILSEQLKGRLEFPYRRT